MYMNPTDYLDKKYPNTTPTEFPLVVTVTANMLLVFCNRIHTRENPAINNGDKITLIGKKGQGRFVFKTAEGYVGDCTADAFKVVL